jgi:hypothetical protein
MYYILTIKIKNLKWGHHWSILTFDVRTIQEFNMKEIGSMYFPQHSEVVYFYGWLYESAFLKHACKRICTNRLYYTRIKHWFSIAFSVDFSISAISVIRMTLKSTP